MQLATPKHGVLKQGKITKQKAIKQINQQLYSHKSLKISILQIFIYLPKFSTTSTTCSYI